ncbi:MAG: hypothetical protein PHO63_06200 [Bacilli bacterium]|nr:hypothetical protein [Bacilli bacterium]
MAKYMTIILIVTFVLLGVLMFLVGRYCKKKPLKIWLATTIILATLYCILISIDINRTNSLREPIFAKENGYMGSMVKYSGLFYTIGLEKNNDTIIQSQMTMFGNTVAAAISDLSNFEIELSVVESKVSNYFGNENVDRSNLGAYRLDKGNNVIIVELVDNSKLKQESFLEKAGIESNYSNYVQFEQGGPYITSNKCDAEYLQVIIGEIREIDSPNYTTRNSKGNIIINIISGLDSEDDIVFYHNSELNFELGKKITIGYNGNRNESDPPQAYADCVEIIE